MIQRAIGTLGIFFLASNKRIRALQKKNIRALVA
jgi:hypothetical protein